MSEYRPLKTGEEIKAGDEFQRPDGSMVVLTDHSISMWKASTGKPLTVRPNDITIRRPMSGDAS